MAVSGSMSVDVAQLMQRLFAPGATDEDKLDAILSLIQLVHVIADYHVPEPQTLSTYGQYEHYRKHLGGILKVLRDKGFYTDEPVTDAAGVQF